MKTRMLVIAAMACFLVGCSPTSRTSDHPWQTLEDCHAANTDLQMRVEALLAENTLLTEQAQTLSTLDNHTRLNSLATLESIHIGKRSGLYDKDDDGHKEKLIVYLEPKDTTQDYIKAIGQCKVELWNLNDEPQAAMIKHWTVGSTDLHGVWGGNIFGAYYRLMFDIDGLLPDNIGEITIKAEFTDFLSGKVVRDRKTIQR